MRTFAADAGHELRTPVATVRAHAELAMRHAAPLPAEVRHAPPLALGRRAGHLQVAAPVPALGPGRVESAGCR
ncbi:histidine kinase dimerization/phospho-acceptor domain-containing protein [Streptomyces sp. NPDC048241]|uniref:histidine kinase dimerization/phospho-acceptor domain-containing protein n=1 Tax=Streptomyces sp. NPDC048241 TaxID=3365521 RepID=UPI003713003E